VLEATDEMENAYPNIKVKTKRFVMISRLYLFLAVVAELILINICVLTEVQSIVYIISGMVLVYGYVFFRYSIIGTSGYRAKALVSIILAVLMLVAIDILHGYNGWSVNYVFPSGIILVDAFILVVMAINYKNWQSYMLQQIFMILCSIAALVLCKIGIITSPILSIIAMNISLIIFLGTLILGGRRARVELMRRFHIS
jgi:hypothetical protein